MNTWQFYLLNLQRLRPMWTISISFVYIALLTWAFPQSHKVNLTYCLKSSLVFASCLLFVCMVDQSQIYASSIWLSILLQQIICDTERLKGGTSEPWITGGPKVEDDLIWKGGDLRPLFIPWCSFCLIQFCLKNRVCCSLTHQ